VTPLRLLFDDCLSKNAVRALADIAQFSRGAVEVSHLANLDSEGDLDDDWIPRLTGAGYLLVTTDRGKKKSRGGKLPILCQRNGMRHVMMSAAVHNLNQFDKLRALFVVWPHLVDASAADAGAGFVLRKKQASGFELVPAPPRKDDKPGQAVQQMFLDGSGATGDAVAKDNEASP
jgi:hypothetical protein